MPTACQKTYAHGRCDNYRSVKKEFAISGTAIGTEASIGVNSSAEEGFFWGMEISGAFVPLFTVSTTYPDSDEYESSHSEDSIEEKAQLLATETSGNFLTIHTGYNF